MMIGRYTARHLAIAAVALVGVAASLARSADGAEIFAGKQIRMIVPGDQAGGYALYAQLAVQHFGRFIPGNPAIVISYMPGAGGLNAMNHLYEVAPRDGTVMGVIAQELPYQQVLGTKGVRYDGSKFNYIGRVAPNVPVHMIWHTAPAKSISELKQREVVTAAVGSVGGQNDLPRAQNALIGTKWKIISGYRGNSETRIAMERGETQAAIGPATLFTEQLRPWLAQRKVEIAVQYADFRHPIFPDVPALVELADTPEAKGVFKLLVSVATLGRAYALPPDVPSETVGILRKAFLAMVKDPEFKADAEKRGADLLSMPGEELAAYVNGIIATSPDIISKTNAVLAAR